MSADYVTHEELSAAIADVRADIKDTEERLREEFTDDWRYEIGKVDAHLTQQDTRLNWTLGLIVTLLLAGISGLIWVALAASGH